jgi:hypothetical protein
MAAKNAAVQRQTLPEPSTLEKALTAHLLAARERKDHIVTLRTTQQSIWMGPGEFVDVADRLANQHGAIDLEFFQLEGKGHLCHIAVLKFPQKPAAKS